MRKVKGANYSAASGRAKRASRLLGSLRRREDNRKKFNLSL